MADDELLQAGIAAAQAGKTDQAAMLLARFLKANPVSEQGWLWLGKCIPDPQRAEYCFQRVLAINPGNREARQRLDQRTNSTAAPLVEAVKPAEEKSPSPLKIIPQAPPAPTFREGLEEPKSIPAPQKISETTHPSVMQTPKRKENQRPSGEKQKKKGQGYHSAALTFFLVSLAGLAGLAYLFLSGQLNRWLSVNMPLAPALTSTVGSSVPTFTQIALPTDTTSPTPLVATILPSPIPTIVYTPTFTSKPCTFNIPTGAVVNCGFLTVPEDRTDPNSLQIQLAVAVFRSTSANPEPDPVIFLQGGPGGEAVTMSAAAFSSFVKPFLETRDFITFDQRGTGMSKPTIDCDELEKASKQDLFGQIPASSRNMIFSNAIRSCHGMMTLSGIDLNAFNTTASADDLKDLVTALGYSQVDLYSASYGTRLALVTMRAHPEILRSVVLDSVVPVEAKFYYEDPSRYNSSLRALFDGCAADPKCAAAYPNLERDFWNLVAQLDAHPVSVTAPLLTGGKITETVSGSDLLGVITLGLLKWGWMIPTAPMSIDQIKAGDYSTFVAMQSSMPDEFKGINIGVYISMMCHEHILAGTPEELQAVLDTQKDLGKYYQWFFFGNAKDIFNTCEVWGSTPPAQGEKDPVISDIPSLIFEGAYDPVTPPSYGKQVAQNLSHSYYLEFPNQGHTPLFGDTTGCASSILQSFLTDPNHEPQQACMAELPSVNFVTPYNGDPPVKLTVEEGFDVTAKMPVEWKKIFDGFYYRNNSPLDITQVAVFGIYADTNNILSLLSSKLYGYEGLDTAPNLVGTRKANGLTWSLYETTSYGRPVELAMADNGSGGSLVVVLFCHKDEHDALYQTVYLPIIDSAKPAP